MGAAGLWLSPVRPSLGQQRQEIRLTGTSEQYRLALERQYTCPNPRLALPTSLLDPRHLSAPVPLPSTSPDFSLTLTYDTTVCNAFSLTISRTDKAHCAAVEASIEPSADPALSTWIKERLGPDSFIVQVDGAERRMDHTPTRYVGACEYAFEFRLANAGPVWVNVTHANQNYEAFREDNLVAGTRHRPELLMTPLVAVPLQLDVCSPSCPTHYAPRLGASSPASYPLAPSTSTSSAPPPCGPRARAGTLTGSYIPTPPIDQLYPPFAVPLTFHLATHSRTSTGYDAFVPSQCAWMHAGVRFADHAPCTRRDERVLFLGDSHGRAAFDVVKVRLEGGGAVASSSVKMEMRNATIGNLFMVRALTRRDPFLIKPLTCELVGTFDALVVSAGTHSAAFDCPTTSKFLSYFSARLSSLSDLLRTCRPPSAAPGRLVFLTMPVQHQHLHDHDCRTGPRVSYWNAELARIARAGGWEVVDVEEYSKPNAVDQRIMDGIHYLMLDAAEPIADDLIDRLEICDVE
ncbi:hypothetical protein DMC30DRAFT_352404 [Rhodotorula diobovata]|uniref:Uncharacterized protein n=1 Tax=Rhodotorula diobovata TaxID=5288 RepID=A0A5C5FUQ7_9BASI|nr:hypothetical protein DMC30DRAFT_352404 [Rhodotorula diobovata]